MSQPFPVIAGNQQLLSDLQQMRRQSHLPHALFLHGAKGCGKKTIARWFTMLVLCENPEAAPCGVCKRCRQVLNNNHPDITYVEHSGKRMGFRIETIRTIQREVGVLPNDGATRLFLFLDADDMTTQAQNALLKSVEEPPPHACFVFTAESVGVMLPTMLSRMTVKAVFPVTEEESAAALARHGKQPEEIQLAVRHFGGNIGRCLQYLEDDALRNATDQASALTWQLAKADEYNLLKTLTAAAADKTHLRRTLDLLDTQLRDAAVLSLDGQFPRLGCDGAAAAALAARLTPNRAVCMHDAIQQALADLDGNVGAILTVTALCATLAEC